MPGLIQDSPYKHITIKELAPTFGAEVQGVDFSQPISAEIFQEIKNSLAKYGVCVFRSTGLDDTRHVEFSRLFGELDDIKPYLTNGRKPRFPYYELFDAGNLDDEGNVIAVDSPRTYYNKGNTLWHVDSSFNPRRPSYSLLLSHTLPPPGGTGGSTQFADTRIALTSLPLTLQTTLQTQDYIAVHSLHHSRKLGSPSYFSSLQPLDHKMSRHKLLQLHSPSNRWNLYIARHIHHIEGLSSQESNELLDYLIEFTTQDRFVLDVEWENEGDLVAWDNRCVMHRATQASFEGVFKRDMRRTTVHDESETAWGLNSVGDRKLGFVDPLVAKAADTGA